MNYGKIYILILSILSILFTCVYQISNASEQIQNESPIEFTTNEYQVNFKTFPWLVKIKSYSNVMCSGTLVSPHFVLTAKHCLDDIKDVYLVYLFNDLKTENFIPSTALIWGSYGDKSTLNKCFSMKEVSLQLECIKKLYSVSQDYALLKLSKPIHLEKYLNLTDSKLFKDDDVEYLGYPHKFKSLIPIAKKCWINHYDQLEKAIKVFCSDMNSINDEKGMSGGPLVKNNQLVGLVSGNDFVSILDLPRNLIEIIMKDRTSIQN